MKLHKKHLLKVTLWALLMVTIQGCASPANYPVTRLAGWAPLENVKWETLELSAAFESQNFSLYKSKTHLLIKAKLKVYGHRTSTYKIKKLHVSQRTIEENIDNVAAIEIRIPGRATLPHQIYIPRYKEEHHTDTINFALIEITPVFELDEEYVKGEAAEFDLVIAEPIQNKRWGRNYYRIQLGDKTLDLGTAQ